jgi:hypothetical protein
MAGIEWSPEELGGRTAQVLDAWNPTLAELEPLASTIRSSWDEDTAWVDGWDPRNPARGQCGSTSLVFQDERGGCLARGLVHDTGRSALPVVHYWNVARDRHVDLTWQQFSAGAFVLRWTLVGREELLTSPWFTDRYTTLRERVGASRVAAALAR